MLEIDIKGGVSPEGIPLIRIAVAAHFTLEQANDIADALKRADVQAALALGSAQALLAGPTDAAEGEPVALHENPEGTEFKPDPALYDRPAEACPVKPDRPLLYDDTDCGCDHD